jgi:DNA-binding transcriptional LysR family regulator
MQQMAAPDLNLLRILISLADSHYVSLAAARLGMTQPGVSNALRRMRLEYGDPLFIRTAAGMQPTPRAAQLISSARVILDLYDREFSGTAVFSPAATSQEIKLAMSDIGEMVFLPRIVAQLQALAPRATIRAVSLPHAHLQSAMRNGAIDLAIGYFPDLKGSQFFQKRLFSHSFVCLVRSDHPCAAAPLTKRVFAQLNHAVVQAEGRSQEVFERYLHGIGLRRRTALHVPHFMSIPYVIAKSDLIVTVPLAVGAAFAERGDIKMLHPAFAVPRFALKQHWHRRVHQDVRNQWLRSTIAAIFTSRSDVWRN